MAGLEVTFGLNRAHPYGKATVTRHADDYIITVKCYRCQRTWQTDFNTFLCQPFCTKCYAEKNQPIARFSALPERSVRPEFFVLDYKSGNCIEEDGAVAYILAQADDFASIAEQEVEIWAFARDKNITLNAVYYDLPKVHNVLEEYPSYPAYHFMVSEFRAPSRICIWSSIFKFKLKFETFLRMKDAIEKPYGKLYVVKDNYETSNYGKSLVLNVLAGVIQSYWTVIATEKLLERNLTDFKSDIIDKISNKTLLQKISILTDEINQLINDSTKDTLKNGKLVLLKTMREQLTNEIYESSSNADLLDSLNTLISNNQIMIKSGSDLTVVKSVASLIDNNNQVKYLLEVD